MSNSNKYSPLQALKAMSPQLESAKRLRVIALDIIESGQPVPMRAGKISQTWLAGTVGLTRQVFHPGRGGKELSEIAGLLLEHVQSLAIKDKAKTPYDQSLASLRSEVKVLRKQLQDTERALLRANFREEILRSGTILTF